MLGKGEARDRLASLLNHAFAEGLLSERTHGYRIDQLFQGHVVDPGRLVGDLTLRRPPRETGPSRRSGTAVLGRAWRDLTDRVRAKGRREDGTETPLLLELDASLGDRLLLGRSARCDVVIEDPWVSRRHAQIALSDGVWTIRDLCSTNGTLVNGEAVGRMTLRPGDRITLGQQTLLVD